MAVTITITGGDRDMERVDALALIGQVLDVTVQRGNGRGWIEAEAEVPSRSRAPRGRDDETSAS